MPSLPAGHPAHVFYVDLDDDTDNIPGLEVYVSGGGRESDTTTLRHWRGTAEVVYPYEDKKDFRVATMSAIIVQPYLGHPLDDLDHIDDDAVNLGAAFFDGQERSDAFMDIADGFGEPVVLISNYTVVPDWRGSVYSTLIAARTLNIFADMGVSAAALQASPAGFKGSDAERRRVQGRLNEFWGSVGFTSLAGKPEFMAAPLDPYESAQLVARLVGENDLPYGVRDD